MKKACSLLIVILFITACNGQNQPSSLQASIDAGIDPYFIESTDTISSYGPDHITRDILQDRNGDFWFATWLGIIKYDGKLFTNYTLQEDLIHFHVFSLYEDKKGNLWFGTARGGVYRYDGKTFTLFTTKNGLPHNTVTSFAEDREGNLWLATEKGVSRFDGKSFTNFGMKDGLSSNNVSTVLQDKTGQLWIASSPTSYQAEDGGISLYNGKSFTKFNDADGKPFKNAVSLFEDSKGNIWIGQFDGLTVYDGKNFSRYLSNSLTYYIIEDRAGNIWLSHSEQNPLYTNIPEQVLYRYGFPQGNDGEPLNKDVKSFTKVIGKYESNDFQIFGKTEDDAGNIWFGTMHGPCRYDGKDFRYFTEQ